MEKILILSDRIYNDRLSKKKLGKEDIDKYEIRPFHSPVDDINLFDDYLGLAIDLKLGDTDLKLYDELRSRWDGLPMVPKEKLEKYRNEHRNWERLLSDVVLWVDIGRVVVLLDGPDVSEAFRLRAYLEAEMEDEIDLSESVDEAETDEERTISHMKHISSRDPRRIFEKLKVNFHTLSQPVSKITLTTSHISGFNPEELIAYRVILEKEKKGKMEKIAVIEGSDRTVSCALRREKGCIVILPQITGKDYFRNLLSVVDHYIGEIIDKEIKLKACINYIFYNPMRNQSYFKIQDGKEPKRVRPSSAKLLIIFAEKHKTKGWISTDELSPDDIITEDIRHALQQQISRLKKDLDKTLHRKDLLDKKEGKYRLKIFSDNIIWDPSPLEKKKEIKKILQKSSP